MGLLNSMLAALSILSLMSIASAAVPVAIGGSSALKALIQAQVQDQSFISFKGGKYVSTNSQDGVQKFKFGVYDIGLSTVPFSPAQETNYVGKKLTIPQAILTVSPFADSVAGIELTPKQIAKILQGSVKTWGEVTALKSDAITPVLRSDPSGVVLVFTQFLGKAASGWPTQYIGEGPFTFGNSAAKSTSGSSAVASLLKATVGGFGFGQSGTYAAVGLAEIAVENRGGAFVSITGSTNAADVQAALPRSPPAAGGSWSGVSLVWQDGPQTYPIVTLAYAFYRTAYDSAIKNAIVNFGKFAQTTAGQGLVSNYYFYALPVAYRVSSTDALKTVS